MWTRMGNGEGDYYLIPGGQIQRMQWREWNGCILGACLECLEYSLPAASRVPQQEFMILKFKQFRCRDSL